MVCTLAISFGSIKSKILFPTFSVARTECSVGWSAVPHGQLLLGNGLHGKTGEYRRHQPVVRLLSLRSILVSSNFM